MAEQNRPVETSQVRRGWGEDWSEELFVISTCFLSNLGLRTCDRRTPLFITSQLFPWKHGRVRNPQICLLSRFQNVGWTLKGKERKIKPQKGVGRTKKSSAAVIKQEDVQRKHETDQIQHSSSGYHLKV